MTSASLSRYGQLIKSHGGQLPDDLSDVSDAQLRGAVIDLMDALEGVQNAFDGLDMNRWRGHTMPPPAVARPMSDVVFRHAGESDTLMTMGWSGGLGNGPVVAAPRDALEQELRTLHAHLRNLEIEVNNVLPLIRVAVAGRPVTDEGVSEWLEAPTQVNVARSNGRLDVKA